jgi:hypothetical protein
LSRNGEWQDGDVITIYPDRDPMGVAPTGPAELLPVPEGESAPQDVEQPPAVRQPDEAPPPDTLRYLFDPPVQDGAVASAQARSGNELATPPLPRSDGLEDAGGEGAVPAVYEQPLHGGLRP